MGFPANNAGAVVYKESWRLVKDQLVARNFTPVFSFAIGEFKQIVAGMRRLRPGWNQVGTESAANNVPRRREAIRQTFNLLRTV